MIGVGSEAVGDRSGSGAERPRRVQGSEAIALGLLGPWEVSVEPS